MPIQTQLERRSMLTLILDDDAQRDALVSPRFIQDAIRQAQNGSAQQVTPSKRPYNRTAKPVAAKRSSGKMVKKTGSRTPSGKLIICPVGGEPMKILSTRHIRAHAQKAGWSKERTDEAITNAVVGSKA